MSIKTDETVALVRDRRKTAENEQKPKFDKFSDFDFIYNNKLKDYDPNIPAKVFNPIAWGFIETVITRMLAKTPVVEYKPREPRDDENAQIFSDLFTYWFDKCNVYPKIVGWVKECLIYGTSVIKVDWYTSKPRQVTSYIYDDDGTPMVGDDGKFMTETSEITDYDDPRVTPVNIYDFFIDPSAKSIEDASWVVYQYWANISDLEQENEAAEAYGKSIYNKEQFKQMRKEKAQNRNDYEERRREATGLNTMQSKDLTVDRCLIWEMWEDDRLVVVADGMKVIRDTKNPYWHGKKPFIYLVDSIVPQSFWGTGEIEPIEKLIHALNSTQNQRITNVNRILAPMWKATTTVDDDELNFTDNGIIHVNDMADVEMLKIDDITSNAYQEGETIKEDAQRALGVTDYVQGVQTPGQTAKEVEIKTSQANARFSHKVKLFEEMGLKELGTIVYQLWQQFSTKPKVIRIVGEEGEKYIQYTPQQLAGEYDVEPESQSTLAVDEEAEYNKFANLYSMVQDLMQTNAVDPNTGMPMQTGFLNQQEWVKKLIKKSGEKNIDPLFAPEPEQMMPQPGMEGMMDGQTEGDPAGGQEAPFLPALVGDVRNRGMEGIGGGDEVNM